LLINSLSPAIAGSRGFLLAAHGVFVRERFPPECGGVVGALHDRTLERKKEPIWLKTAASTRCKR